MQALPQIGSSACIIGIRPQEPRQFAPRRFTLERQVRQHPSGFALQDQRLIRAIDAGMTQKLESPTRGGGALLHFSHEGIIRSEQFCLVTIGIFLSQEDVFA
jgi:hypothetical protein